MTNTSTITAPVNLLNLLPKLSPQALLVLQFKALLFPDQRRSRLLETLKASEINIDGIPKSSTSLIKITKDLLLLGLLNDDDSCPETIQHYLTADLFAKHGNTLSSKTSKLFPDINHRYLGYPEIEIASRLRFAIYANEADRYKHFTERYNSLPTEIKADTLLKAWFGNTYLTAEWLSKLDLEIQYSLFATKNRCFMKTGQMASDFADLVEYYRRYEDQPAYEKFRYLLIEIDIFTGKISETKRKIETSLKDDPKAYIFLSSGIVNFIEGNNPIALEHFNQGLKLHKKIVGKRKFFFNDATGLFFLLALIKANDPSLYPEIESHLAIADSCRSQYFCGFIAIQALLLLLQGKETKARERLAQIPPDSESLSIACRTLVEFLLDSTLVKITSTRTHFKSLKGDMPLLAYIHAEILEKMCNEPSEYTTFLSKTQNKHIAIRFTEIVTLLQPWERTLNSLATLLNVNKAKTTTVAPATNKSKRLAWFVNLTNNQWIEALEQSSKANARWSAGRAVSMQRLHDQDPRLDYLTNEDRCVLRTICSESSYTNWYREETYDFHPYLSILALVGHPLVFDANEREKHLELVAYPVELIVTEEKGNYKFTLSHHAAKPTAFLEPETPTRWRVVDFSSSVLAVQEILGKSGLTVPRQGREHVLEILKHQHPSLAIRTDITDADLPSIEGQTESVLQIQPLGEGLKVALVVRPFGPSGPYYLPGQGGQSPLALVEGTRKRANRNLDAESASAKATLAALPTLLRDATSDHEWIIGDLESSLEFLLEVRAHQPPLSVEWPEGKKFTLHTETSASNLSLKIARARDWFQIEGKIQVNEDLVLDIQDVLKRNATQKSRFVQLDDGSFLALTQRFQKQLERLSGITESSAKGLRLSRLGSVAIQELVDETHKVKADKEWKEWIERISAAERHQPIVPSTLQAELRDYQIEGFKWLSRLAHWQAGACLADDMGLGKTVQAIAVMLEQAPHGPCIVIAPTSVCHNWEHELERFAPTLTIKRLGSNNRAELITSLQAMDVLVTSYGLLHQEADLLAEVNWRMAIFDEAQAIKNASTRRSQAGQRINAHFRLALTGTPIENYLEELWSLFAIVNPGLLGSRESFMRRFATPIERNRSESALHSLRALIRPFILRRTKSTVLSELPPRTELTIEIDLPEEERAFYEAIRRQALESLAQLSNAKGSGNNRIHILAEITRLRRTCCHPGLVDSSTELPGAKLETFLELVDELIRNRHKALVFSQFVGQLEKVREALVARGISHQYLDGSTPVREREKRVTAFQAGEGDVFLISLKAGGTGLNLTAADYVIHMDPWWNPAVEDQASDRAHRIGQSRPVTVYRLIVRDSIEEKILALHRTKRDLASDILEGSEMSARLTDDDLLDLIRT